MREKAATARKGPAGLGDLDDVLAGKGEPMALPAVASKGEAMPVGESARAEQPERGGATLSTIRIPHYLSERIANYLHENRGDTQQTMFFKGLVKLGIQVEPEDLVPKRQRRSR